MSNCSAFNFLSYIATDRTCSCYHVCAYRPADKDGSLTFIQYFTHTWPNESINWMCFKDSCYTVGVYSITYYDALEYCEYYNATLVSIHSDYENDLVFSL